MTDDLDWMLDEDLDEGPEGTDEGTEGEAPAEKAAFTLEDLEALSKRPGPLQGVYADLLDARKARDAAAERKALAESAEALIEEGKLDLSDPGAVDQLRVLQEQREQAADASYLALRRVELDKAYGPETAALMMRNEEAAIAEVAGWFGDSDAVFQAPELAEYQAEKFAESRQNLSLANYLDRERSWDDLVAEANDGIRAQYEKEGRS